MTLDEVKRRVAELDADLGWYQNIDLKNGVQTKTRRVWGEEADHPRQRWEWMQSGFPTDFTGKTVLDVGCNAGFFSFVAAERGAKRVLGVDLKQGYIDQARFANDVRGDKVEFQTAGVNDVTKFGEQFDITICIGLLYHVRDIYGAIEAIAAVTKEMAIVESAIHPGNEGVPLVRVAPGKGGLPGIWHPNITALRFMFERVGFARTEQVFGGTGRGGIVAYK